MKISIGSDHRGVDLKSSITGLLKSAGHDISDCGTHSSDSCDYPVIAHEVAHAVAASRADRGILICGSGLGMSMAANKTPRIRAALCHDAKAAEMSRRHNDANVLCLSAERLDDHPSIVNEIISTWMETEFEGGRHQRRVDQIDSRVDSSASCHD